MYIRIICGTYLDAEAQLSSEQAKVLGQQVAPVLVRKQFWL